MCDECLEPPRNFASSRETRLPMGFSREDAQVRKDAGLDLTICVAGSFNRRDKDGSN